MNKQGSYAYTLLLFFFRMMFSQEVRVDLLFHLLCLMWVVIVSNERDLYTNFLFDQPHY